MCNREPTRGRAFHQSGKPTATAEQQDMRRCRIERYPSILEMTALSAVLPVYRGGNGAGERATAST